MIKPYKNNRTLDFRKEGVLPAMRINALQESHLSLRILQIWSSILSRVDGNLGTKKWQ